MGDRYFLEITCPKCGFHDDSVYYAPTCGFTTWKCECGWVVGLAEYTGITEADASNRIVIEQLVREVYRPVSRTDRHIVGALHEFGNNIRQAAFRINAQLGGDDFYWKCVPSILYWIGDWIAWDLANWVEEKYR